MSYQHLSTFERGSIEQLKRLGYSHRYIAKQIGRHHSCIDREIRRNETTYTAEQAHESYLIRRKNSKPMGKKKGAIIDVIVQKLQDTWSPEQIANTVTEGIVSFKTIYNWLYQGVLTDISLSNLRHKGKRKKSDKRSVFSMGVSIAKRPKEVRNRATFGHWELDTMVSSRGKSKGCFATFIERKSRLYTAFKIKDRTATSMQSAIEQLYQTLPKGAFQTATTDRGKEFACASTIHEKLGLTLYFADPYSSWQRGSNENSNGLLREFYPKQTDLSTVDQQQLTYHLFLINSRPRKCLGWKSPIQVFLHELAHLT